MSDVQPNQLAAFGGKGYVIAPAGYGKSHLIALAVKESQGKQLVLTHTFAGVCSIKAKMRALLVPARNYQIDTIASWALKMCLDYPKTSGWSNEYPSGADWNDVYKCCAQLLENGFFQHIIKCSYSGIYVDEYQDCSVVQHQMVCSIARGIPCRILGDPMQAIFDFTDDLVDWERLIIPHFTCLGELSKPWRWYNSGFPELGGWLDDARKKLIAGRPIHLTGGLPRGIRREYVDLADFTNPRRLNLFFGFLDEPGSVTAIYSGDAASKNKAHQLARSLSGRFSSIEEIEGKELLSFARKVDTARTPKHQLCEVIAFAKKCCNSIESIVTAAMKRGEVTRLTRSTRFPLIASAANDYLATSCTARLAKLFSLIQDAPGVTVYRRDLFFRLMSVLHLHQQDRTLTLEKTAQEFHRSMRNTGRPIRHNKVIATTLLVKGLEYDHAIVIEADTMKPKDLYVALTRGAKSVTIVTARPNIGAV